jgi:hypothetical protein
MLDLSYVMKGCNPFDIRAPRGAAVEIPRRVAKIVDIVY